jgi:hypothetical protein
VNAITINIRPLRGQSLCIHSLGALSECHYYICPLRGQSLCIDSLALRLPVKVLA